jgi:hypothetical protein
MTRYYFCWGSVRGSCGHKHRTEEGAWRCLRRDAEGCRQQGGYTDRQVYLVHDDGTMDPIIALFQAEYYDA